MGKKNRAKKPDQKPDQRRRVISPKGGAALVPGNPGNAGGQPGRSGRPKDEVRLGCRVAFDEAVPVLRAIVKGELPDVSTADRMRAADVLGRYGGMAFTETEAKVDLKPPPNPPIYYLPINGRDPRQEVPDDDQPPPRAARPATRPAPSNGGGAVVLPNGQRAYRWRDGSLMNFREPED
jgi:hypothetical protein